MCVGKYVKTILFYLQITYFKSVITNFKIQLKHKHDSADLNCEITSQTHNHRCYLLNREVAWPCSHHSFGTGTVPERNRRPCSHLFHCVQSFRNEPTTSRCDRSGTVPERVRRRNFFPINTPGMGRFQLLDLWVLRYGLALRFWVVIAIIVSLTLTITLITAKTII